MKKIQKKQTNTTQIPTNSTKKEKINSQDSPKTNSFSPISEQDHPPSKTFKRQKKPMTLTIKLQATTMMELSSKPWPQKSTGLPQEKSQQSEIKEGAALAGLSAQQPPLKDLTISKKMQLLISLNNNLSAAQLHMAMEGVMEVGLKGP